MSEVIDKNLKLCHCGTIGDAFDAAARLFDQTAENNCTVWAFQIAVCMNILARYTIGRTEVGPGADMRNPATHAEALELTVGLEEVIRHVLGDEDTFKRVQSATNHHIARAWATEAMAKSAKGG